MSVFRRVTLAGLVSRLKILEYFFCGSFEGAKLSKKNNPVVMAKGIHLFPSRTQ